MPRAKSVPSMSLDAGCVDLTRDLWQDWPCRLVNNANQGRYLVATKDLKSAEVVLLSEAYLAALIPSFKKRICHLCLEDHQQRLATSCRLCNQAWYCSAQCQEAHLSGQLSHSADKLCATPAGVTAHSRHQVPHSLTCAVLKRFSSIKCDPGMESVIRMCLDAMALQYLAHNDQPCPDFTSCEVPAGILHLPASPHEEGSQDLRQQLIHLSGQQIPTPKQAPHMIPMHPPTNDAIQQQLHSMSMQRLELPDQTSKPSLNDISQPSESVKPSSPSTIAEPCATASHAPHIHPESLESVQAAFSLGLPAKVKEQPAAQLPCLTHANLMQLQSHAADFTDKDRRDWLVSLKFLRSAMQHADWPGDIWSEGALLDMVGRIASNNFGIYSTRQVSKLQHPVTPSKSCTPAAVADQVTSCQSQCSLPPDSALPHSNEQATWSQNQSSLHESVEQQTLPDSLPPKFKARDALRQPCLHEADASSAAVPTKVLPWPLQAETQPPLPPPSQTPVAEGRTPQGSPQTLDRPTDHQPHQAGFPMLLSGKMGSSNDEYLNNKGMKAHGQQLPARQKPAKEDVVGREMYITASFFNHSCEPNCVKHRLLGQQSGIATVTALRDIKAGEALTISYIDLELPRSARQLELKTCFFFDCKCVRCERELIEGSKKCSYAHSQTQRKNQAPKRRGTKARVSRY